MRKAPSYTIVRVTWGFFKLPPHARRHLIVPVTRAHYPTPCGENCKKKSVCATTPLGPCEKQHLDEFLDFLLSTQISSSIRDLLDNLRANLCFSCNLSCIHLYFLQPKFNQDSKAALRNDSVHSASKLSQR